MVSFLRKTSKTRLVRHGCLACVELQTSPLHTKKQYATNGNAGRPVSHTGRGVAPDGRADGYSVHHHSEDALANAGMDQCWQDLKLRLFLWFGQAWAWRVELRIRG